MIIQVTVQIEAIYRINLATLGTELSEHLEQGKRNAMSASKTTQNEIISIIGDSSVKRTLHTCKIQPLFIRL